MRKLLQRPERRAAEIHHVEMDVLRRIFMRQGQAQRFQQIRFSRTGSAVHKQIAFLGEIDAQRLLALAPRIVEQADRHAEQVAARGPAAEVRPEAFLRTVNIVQVDGIRQRRQPRPFERLDSVRAGHRDDMIDHRLQLGRHFLFGDFLFFARINLLRPAMQRYFVNALGPVFPFEQFALRIIIRAGVGRLEQLENFVVPDLDIRPARLLDHRRVRALDHVFAVRLVLHLETNLELGVAPDLIVDDAGRFLRGQNQMHAKASADPGRADQLLHEIGLILLQLGELVGDHDQVRYRRHARLLGAAPAVVQLLIPVDVVDPIFREHALPAHQFAFDRQQRPRRLVPAEVGDRPDEMGHPFENVGHPAAFIVDQHEHNVMRMIVQRQRDDDALQKFAFPRTGRAGDKPVRAVSGFVHVQVKWVPPGLDADRHAHPLKRLVANPARGHVDFPRRSCAKQFEQRQRDGQRKLGGRVFDAQRRQPPGRLIQLGEVGLVGKEGGFLPGFPIRQLPGFALQQHDLTAVHRQVGRALGDKHRRHAQ